MANKSLTTGCVQGEFEDRVETAVEDLAGVPDSVQFQLSQSKDFTGPKLTCDVSIECLVKNFVY